MLNFFVGRQLHNMKIQTVTIQDYVKMMGWFVGSWGLNIPTLDKVGGDTINNYYVSIMGLFGEQMEALYELLQLGLARQPHYLPPEVRI